MFYIKELNPLFPLITWKMWFLQVLPVILSSIGSVLVMIYADTEVVMVCSVIYALVICALAFSFTRDLSARGWVRSNAIGCSYNIIYVANTDSMRASLGAEVSRLCDLNVVGMVSRAIRNKLGSRNALSRLVSPKVIIVIIQHGTGQHYKKQGTPWRAGLFYVGTPVWVPWRDENLRMLRTSISEGVGMALFRNMDSSMGYRQLHILCDKTELSHLLQIGSSCAQWGEKRGS